MNLLKISLMVISTKIFQKPSVKGTLSTQFHKYDDILY
jgi:hypothetical protein